MSSSTSFPSWLERSLAGLVLILKALHLWKFWGVLIGYDMGDHLLRYEQTDWWMPEPALHGSFYAYHPPLGFLLPHFIARLGVESLPAMQIFTTICGATAFLCLRAIMGQLRLLENVIAVVFLYLWAGVPILVNCDVSLNLDVAILACGLALLFCALRLWGPEPETSPPRRVFLKCVLVLIQAGGLMIKFSALLFLATPALVILVFGKSMGQTTFRSLIASTVLLLLAAALVFPYYFQRYYLPEKTFLPRNEDFWIPADIEEARRNRDQDRVGFVAKLLTPAFLQPAREIETRATDHLRYSDVWRDFWIRDSALYYQPEVKLPRGMPVVIIGTVYSWILSILCLGGLIVWLRSAFRSLLDRLGLLLVLQGGIFVSAHLAYCYCDATAIYSTAKGIYVLPATLGVAFLAARFLALQGSLPQLRTWSARIGIVTLPGWLLLNYLWPVY